MAEGAVLLRGFARPVEAELIAALREIVAQAPFRRMFDARRPPDVGGDDQLRRCRLGHRSQRLSLRRRRSRIRQAVAGDAGSRFASWPASAAARGRLCRLCAGCLPDQPLRARRARCRCIRTGTSRILPRRSSRCRWACPRSSCSAASKRSDKPRRYRLQHGDVVVWGGPSRLFFHGVAPLADGEHALLGRQRINLTFRKAR